MSIQRTAVIGSGLMGAGIAEVLAKSGLDVIVREINEETSAAGRARIEKSLARAVDKGKLDAAARDEALGRLRFTTDINDLADRQLVIEAASENEDIKKSIFAELDKVVTDPEAILASNTSSMPIIRFAQSTSRPERVLGVHFFNPAPVQPLVEIVSSVLTAEDVRDTVTTFVADVLGKNPIQADDRPGFIVNALLIPYLLSAVRMLESGFATKEDIRPRSRPASSSTPCSSRTCSARSGCSSPGSRRRRTSTQAWWAAARTRWARSSSPTSSDSTPASMPRRACMRRPAIRPRSRRSCSLAWSMPDCSV
jgi:3-hydroxybutyryl-CoA dehydrogenase